MTASSTPYQRLGGEKAVKALAKAFYQIMDETPEVEQIRNMHPENLSNSEHKFYLFLSGWLGGPDLYIAQYGHPRLRRRHLPFSIGIEERDQWLYCMAHALMTLDIERTLAEQLMQAFAETADFMRNREQPTST